MGYHDPGRCDVAALKALTARETGAGDVPHAARIAARIPVYDADALPLTDPEARRALMAEWAAVLKDGAGVLVIERALPDGDVIDRVTAVFEAIIAAEKAAGGEGADHFAAAGSNDRVWNALQKLCLADPEAFALYHGAPAIDAVCEAWLGPGYQVTAQVNLVRPGGAAQEAHRDYHLGFQTAEGAAAYPAHVHALTAALTLQGAVAHCDMPVESGPTQLLPFSQTWPEGYVAFRHPEVRAHFAAHAVQLPLRKGDAVFFNPALLHAAGANRTADVHRMANLLQVSSAFGRAMEAVDRLAMCEALYPALLGLAGSNAMGPAELRAAIAAAAEGYAFPTNLDTDPPVGGLAPETQGALMARMLAAGAAPEAFIDAARRQWARRAA